MKKVNARFILNILLLLITISSLFVTSSCSFGHKEAVFKDGDIAFSFQYPSSYTERERSSDGIVLWKYISSSNLSELSRAFFIKVWGEIDVPNANAFLEDSLKTRQYFWSNFVLHDRSQIEVDGIKAEKVIYSGEFEEMRYPYTDYKVFAVYLDYHDMIWEILLVSDANEQNSNAEQEFNVIIDSFKFLN
jgi:hypothetical protein